MENLEWTDVRSLFVGLSPADKVNFISYLHSLNSTEQSNA